MPDLGLISGWPASELKRTLVWTSRSPTFLLLNFGSNNGKLISGKDFLVLVVVVWAPWDLYPPPPPPHLRSMSCLGWCSKLPASPAFFKRRSVAISTVIWKVRRNLSISFASCDMLSPLFWTLSGKVTDTALTAMDKFHIVGFQTKIKIRIFNILILSHLPNRRLVAGK